MPLSSDNDKITGIRKHGYKVEHYHTNYHRQILWFVRAVLQITFWQISRIHIFIFRHLYIIATPGILPHKFKSMKIIDSASFLLVTTLFDNRILLSFPFVSKTYCQVRDQCQILLLILSEFGRIKQFLLPLKPGFSDDFRWGSS